jgi:hypothetical protein
MELEIFDRGFRKRKLSLRITCVVLLPIAVAGIVWGLTDHTDPQMARMVALGILALPLFLGLLIASFFPARGLAALAAPQTIVWFYGSGKGGYIHTILLGLESGKLRSLPLPHHREADQAMLVLGQLAPWATQGFSEEVRRKFKRDPGSLRIPG